MRAAVTMIAAVMAAFFATAVHAQCGNKTVSVDEINMVVTPKELEVCNGDVVTWQSNGSEMFHVIFAAGGPPGSPQQGDGFYSVTISAQPGRYPYDVKIKGVSLDPTIIVFR